MDLSEEALTKAVSAAQHAFDLAADLDELGRAKTEHLGDRTGRVAPGKRIHHKVAPGSKESYEKFSNSYGHSGRMQN